MHFCAKEFIIFTIEKMQLSLVHSRNYKILFFPQEGSINNYIADAKYIVEQLSPIFSYIRVLKNKDNNLIVYCHSANEKRPVRMSKILKLILPFYKRAILPYYQYVNDDNGYQLLLSEGEPADRQRQTHLLNSYLEDVWVRNLSRKEIEEKHLVLLKRYKHFYRNMLDIRDGHNSKREKEKNLDIVNFLK